MPSVALTQQNFNAGELSLSISNRINLQVYYNGLERMENFIPTIEGNAKFRTGTTFIEGIYNNELCRAIPFVSSENNRYLLIFTPNSLKIYKDKVLKQTILTVPYREEDLFNIKVDSTENTMYFVDGYNIPYKLLKTGVDTFSFDRVDFDNSAPPSLSENISVVTIQASATTGTITLTASVALFTLRDIGRYVKIRDLTDYGYARITSLSSGDPATVANAIVTKTLPVSTPVITWAFSPFPNAVTFYEQRLIYGQFNILWLSKTPDDNGVIRYDDFGLGTKLDDGLHFESGILGGEIQWLTSTDRMLAIGTYTGEFKADTGNLNEAISIENPPTIKRISSHGSANINALQKDNLAFFVEKDKNIVNVIRYSFENDGYIINNLMLLSKEIAKEGIKQIAFFNSNGNILFAIKNNGELIGCLFDQIQSIQAWFRIKTEGEVESIATVPDSNGEDILYITVKRIINSVEKRYLEYLDHEILLPILLDYYTGNGNKDNDLDSYRLDLSELQKDYNFLDSAVKYDGSIQTVSMTPSAITGDDILFTSSGALFNSSDIDREIWEKEARGRAKIITYISPTQVKCNIIYNFKTTNLIPAGDWYFTTDTITGLSHLEDRNVKAITDGGYGGDYVVDFGEVVLTQQASKISIGLPYKGIMKTFNLEGGAMNGSSRTSPKIINRLGIYFLDTVGAKFGTDLYDLNVIPFGPSEIMGYPIETFTGYRDIIIPERYEEKKNIFMIQDIPSPCTIQMIAPLMEANNAN